MRRQPTNTFRNPDSAPNQDLAQIKRTLTLYRRIGYLLTGLIVIGGIGLGALTAYHYYSTHRKAPDPVPISIRHSVNFSVYYPVQSKLPPGYSLDTSSFSSNGLAVVYKVHYPGNHQLVFSVQQKPSAAAIQTFYTNHLPLRTSLSTPVGNAALSAIGIQSVVSLPTNDNAWLLITGPSDLTKQQLLPVLQTLTHAD